MITVDQLNELASKKAVQEEKVRVLEQQEKEQKDFLVSTYGEDWEAKYTAELKKLEDWEKANAGNLL